MVELEFIIYAKIIWIIAPTRSAHHFFSKIEISLIVVLSSFASFGASSLSIITQILIRSTGINRRLDATFVLWLIVGWFSILRAGIFDEISHINGIWISHI